MPVKWCQYHSVTYIVNDTACAWVWTRNWSSRSHTNTHKRACRHLHCMHDAHKLIYYTQSYVCMYTQYFLFFKNDFYIIRVHNLEYCPILQTNIWDRLTTCTVKNYSEEGYDTEAGHYTVINTPLHNLFFVSFVCWYFTTSLSGQSGEYNYICLHGSIRIALKELSFSDLNRK